MVDPYGHYVTQPVWDREAIICADLDLTQVPRSRMEFDGCGHYARAGRAEADRGRPVTEMPKEEAPL